MTQSTRNETRTSPRIEHLTESESHRLLTVERRRITLDILSELTTPIELQDLAEMVAQRENDEIDEDNIISEFHHIHLPMMADFDVIDYDPAITLIEVCP